jgi:AcrR family transcriptional regulator
VAKARSRNARGEGAHLRQDILEATIRLIDKAGSCEAVSLRAVAKEVGIAAPSIYAHFGDREELLLAVLKHLFERLIALRTAAEDDAMAAGGGPWECLRAGAIATIRFGLDSPGRYKMLFEGRVISGLGDKKAAAFGRPIQERVMAHLNALPKSATRRQAIDSERLSLLIWSATHGVVSLQINKPTFPWPEATALVEDLMRAILGSAGIKLP